MWLCDLHDLRLAIPRLALIISATLASGSVDAMEIRDVVALAVARAPELATDRSLIRQQEIAIEIERDGRLPSLQGSVEIGTNNETRQEIRLSQTIYDWGLTGERIQREQGEHLALSYAAQSNRESLILEVSERYIDWASANLRVQELESYVESIQGLVDLTRRRVGTVVDRVELTRAELALARGQERLVEARGDEYEAGGQLEQRIGTSLDMQSAPAIPEWGAWYADKDHRTLNNWIKASPDVQEASANITTAEAELGVAKSERMPRLSVEAVAERVEDSLGDRTENRFAVRIETPVFQGFSAWRRPRSAAHGVTAARKDYQRLIQERERSLRSSLMLLQVYRDRLPAVINQLEASDVTIDLYMKQFRVGRRDIVDVLGAENERLSARLSAIDIAAESARLSAGMAVTFGQLETRIHLTADPSVYSISGYTYE